jgi:hypothetical protein
MPAFSSIILRFRDLSTPAGTTTVDEHKKIIQAKGSVWWGWWHKQGEIVPESAFREIRAEIKKSGRYEIFLFDTGKHKLHRATLVDIKWDATLSPIATPEHDDTPAYYNDAHYLAWFKLDGIQDAVVPEAELHKWSYVRVDELFETKKSVFDAFYDKQLSSFVELRNQDRTIWFIRPKKAADGVHEIHVYDRSKTTPSNFPDDVVQLHTPNLLWVSDPHFSDDHHDFPRENEASRFNLSETIRRDLEAMGIRNVGGLVITGDLTWRASRAEFDWAAKFIDDIKSWAKLTASQVLVCPGNHDLAFSRDPWVKGARATEVGEAAAAEYIGFYERLYEVRPTKELACGRRFWVPDGDIIDVAALNSSVLQQIPEAFQGQGFLGAPQLLEVGSAMKWSREPHRARAFRICMLHHHVVPILHREHPDIGTASSMVYDAGALMRWLTENEVDLVLHGHMHLPSFVKESRALDYPKLEKWHEITVAALGSSGVKADHRPNQPNSYGLLQFTSDGVKLLVRKISADDSIPDAQRVVYSTVLKRSRT